MLIQQAINRRTFCEAAIAAGCGMRAGSTMAAPQQSTGRGDVQTPVFYRHDIGTAPGRLHEPSVGRDGNIWTSPLDGNLWRYHAPSGEVEIFDLQELTGRNWAGLHLWPIAQANSILLCTPKLPLLWVWDRAADKVTQYAFPHDQPSVYGGFVVDGWNHIYLYDTKHQSVLKWDPAAGRGVHFPCPYELSGTLYMSFVDRQRQEYWGSTYTGNDLVRFDVKSEQWTGHFKCPLAGATPTAGGRVFHGDTLYVSDHLNGRIIPLNIETKQWSDPIPVPGYRDWFGYLSGGFLFRDTLYLDHSTWTGGTSSIDGEPHHFIGSWTVFDPHTREFSRLDIPTRGGEESKYLQSDYCAAYDNELYILAVDRRPPHRVVVHRSKPLG